MTQPNVLPAPVLDQDARSALYRRQANDQHIKTLLSLRGERFASPLDLASALRQQAARIESEVSDPRVIC